MTVPPSENLSQRVYEVIRQKLILGELEPGAPLSIRTLAKELAAIPPDSYLYIWER